LQARTPFGLCLDDAQGLARRARDRGRGAVENTKLRARWIRYSISVSLPATKAPAARR